MPTSNPGAGFLYDAFISYSHKADGALAVELQRGLERIATPWYRRRAMRVFRDETTLKATPALWPAIQEALDRSRYFILLASPEAAASEWVDKEVAHWLAHPSQASTSSADRLLICLTEGTLTWRRAIDGAADFTEGATAVLPPALRGAFRDEPLYVDFTWADRPERLGLRRKPFHDNVARLAAPIRGMELDDLIGEDIRQHRRTMASAAAGGVLLVALAVTAYRASHEAGSLIEEKRHQTDADRVLPQLDAQLKDVRTQPTRSVSFELDPTSPAPYRGKILELRLELDPLFTVPMSFFFADYVEGRTWPAEFGFVEAGPNDFRQGQARIDAQFAWFDRIVPMRQVIDGTDSGTPPTFSLELDGSDFMPGGRGVHMRQKLEIPSLQALIDRRVRFRLLVHDPATRQAREIDLANEPVGLRVLAHQPQVAAGPLVLFDGRPTPLQNSALGGDYLINRGPIEKTVLLNLYPPVIAERTAASLARRAQLQRLLETRKAETSDDRRLLSRALVNAGRLAAFRGDSAAALADYAEVVALLKPLVLDAKNKPLREDGERLHDVALQPVAFHIRARQFDRVAAPMQELSAIVDRMATSDPDDPAYARWRAQRDLWAARSAIGSSSWSDAAGALASAVETMRSIDARLKNANSRSELAATLRQAADLARALPAGSVPAAGWMEEAQRQAGGEGQRSDAEPSTAR